MGPLFGHQTQAASAWRRYFLQALRTRAEASHRVALAILALCRRLKRDAPDWTRSQYTVPALDWMFERPIFRGIDFVAKPGIPAPTAKRLLAVFRQHRLFSVLLEGRGRRNSVFAMKELLNLA